MKVRLIVSSWFEKIYVWSAQNNQIIDRYLTIYILTIIDYQVCAIIYSCVQYASDYVKARNTAAIVGSMTQFVKIRLDSEFDDETVS